MPKWNAPAYEWLCKACGEPNPAGLGVCANCGFQAIASPALVERNKLQLRATGANEQTAEDSYIDGVEYGFAKLKTLHQVIVVAAYGCAVIGVFVGKYADTVLVSVFGWVFAVASVAVLCHILPQAKRSKQQISEPTKISDNPPRG